jgi:hypothetical protein
MRELLRLLLQPLLLRLPVAKNVLVGLGHDESSHRSHRVEVSTDSGMWVTTTDSPTGASHPFHRRLNQLLRYGRSLFSALELSVSNNCVPHPKMNRRLRRPLSFDNTTAFIATQRRAIRHAGSQVRPGNGFITC